MPITKYIQITPERRDILNQRYAEFCKALDKPDVPPVKVFDPLSAKNVEEILLIRELSKQLQKKKEDDIKKAAQAAAEAEKEAEAKAAEEAAKAAEQAEQAAEENSEVKEE